MTSAKTQFLTKLRAHRSVSRPFDNQVQADIAALSRRIADLKMRAEAWLDGTGIEVGTSNEQLTDLLAGQQAFPLPGIRLRYAERTIAFSPLFLYGHGVTGCLEISLRCGGRRSPLGRLFMRAGRHEGWMLARTALHSDAEESLTEEAFFSLLAPLLPE